NLADAERTLLPSGINEAIRVRWNWPDLAERAAPDVSAFRVYQDAGMPNVLDGEVHAGVVVAGDRATLTVAFSALGATPAEVLTGRDLRQGRRSYRILSQDEGVLRGGVIELDIVVRVAL